MAVVQCGTMGKAVDGLSISQPIASKAIADLEHSPCVRPLDRSSQGIEQTFYGRALTSLVMQLPFSLSLVRV
jgi:DNA-binding transcriptional LysR family regulator